MTTQSPHLYSRRYARQRAPHSRQDAGEHTAAAAPAARAPKAAGAQTRLPWWAVALPAVAFAALLALLSAGSANASASAGGADLVSRLATALGPFLHHLL